jgi:hypothetical protein
MKSVNDLVEELRQEEQRLVQEIGTIKKQLGETSRQLDRVRAGIQGLSGKKAPKKKAASKSSRPSVETVVEMVSEVLEEASPQPEAAIEAKIREKLKAAGKPAAGLRPQLEKALKDSRFEAGLTGWKLMQFTVKASQPQLAVENA